MSAQRASPPALKLRQRVDLGPQQRYRLVGVGLSNFREPEGTQHNQRFSNEGLSVSCGGSSWLVLHHLLHSFLHFFGCRFRLVRTDHPCVTVWIYDSAAAIAPEHVHHGVLRCCAKLSACGILVTALGSARS
ncbi:MAG: hypothetical protein QOF94_122 [Acidobacteriaceae bacterium]